MLDRCTPPTLSRSFTRLSCERCIAGTTCHNLMARRRNLGGLGVSVWLIHSKGMVKETEHGGEKLGVGGS